MAKAESENVRDILVSLAAVDSAAFALLYDIYYERIFSYCVSRIRARQAAEDLTSAAFLAAAKTISKFRGKTRTEFADWLYAIATAKINLYLRKKQIIEKLMATVAEIQAAKAQDSQPDAITWPMLHNAILKLRLKEQTIIALRFFENLAIDRIAEITGSRPDTVRLRIARALENIKMFNTERQFEDVIEKISIDNVPDTGHKERLRAKILRAFNAPSRNKYRIFLYSLAAAIVLITAGLLLRFYGFGGIPPPAPRSIIKLPKRAAEANLPQLQQGEEKSRLEKIRQLAAEKDIAGLLDILESDDLTARLLAAKFLAELTDSNTADIIKLVSPAGKQADSNKTAIQKPQQQKTLYIRTIDKKTKQVLADVWLQIRFDGEKNMLEVPTDSNGQYLLVLPAESLNRLQIRAAMKGYAAMKMQRRSALTVPEAILFEMSQVSEIGGLVVDEQLKPVESAEVKVRVDSDFNSELPVVDADEIFKTDVNGIWRCDSFPRDACQVSVMVMHPDYISQESYQSVVVEQNENPSYLMVLEKGVTVTGRVLDWEQKPLQAAISKGTDRRENPVICDPNGWFRFDNIAPRVETFTAQCEGAAPQIQQVDIGPNMPPIVFNLEPANTIRARVVDINDTPLKDVYARTLSWHGFSSLNFEAKTDANGFFQWTGAPADEVLFDLYKPGYMRISNFGMTSKNDYVITLLPPFRISGTVTSSDPNRPVNNFKITQGIYRNDSNQILWQEFVSSVFSDNRYELTVTEPYELRLKVEADGFEPAQSPIFSPEQGAAEYDFVLTPVKTNLYDTVETQ